MFMYVAVIVGMLFGAWIGDMVIDRDPPAVLVERHIETTHVKRGDALKYINVVDRERTCVSTIERYLVDGQNYRHQLPTTHAMYMGPLGRVTYGQTLTVPAVAHMGTATLYVTVSYVCNPIHNLYPIVVKNPPLIFTIIE